jgi:hypothetical protein
MDEPSKKHIARTALGLLTTVIGLGCLIVAGLLAFGMQTVHVVSPTAEVSNITAAGGACGFAIAGGLCFLATAIAERARERS